MYFILYTVYYFPCYIKFIEKCQFSHGSITYTSWQYQSIQRASEPL